uniref:Uncharacterized protein n=1 Tax=Anguilla anguilla TaxID=7936 RepID=A0A0E9UQM4_ANGAN
MHIFLRISLAAGAEVEDLCTSVVLTGTHHDPDFAGEVSQVPAHLHEPLGPVMS